MFFITLRQIKILQKYLSVQFIIKTKLNPNKAYLTRVFLIDKMLIFISVVKI